MATWVVAGALRVEVSELTKDVMEEVKVAWVLGYTYDEIAKMFETDNDSIYRVIHDIMGRSTQYRLEEEDYREMVALYDEERWTYAEIAEHYDVGVGTVRFHLARCGARIRRRGWKQAKDKELRVKLKKLKKLKKSKR
jgi:DNA-directed RNA polymerase specialized sigma24 family protein